MAEYDILILCGGKSSRMGGMDKGLLPLFDKPIIEHILDQLLTQTQSFSLGQIYISANRNVARYAQYGYPVLIDARQGFFGPLAGIETVMQVSQAEKIFVIPCDVPLLPSNLLVALAEGFEVSRTVSYAIDCKQAHPTICLVSCSQQATITNLLNSEKYRLQDWLRSVGAVGVKFDIELSNLNDVGTLNDYISEVSS